MSSAEAADLREPSADRDARRFAVAWRNRTRQFVAPVGVLDHDDHGYRFQYLGAVAAGTVDQFRPFVGFPDVHRAYESLRLWPFFALRVMDRKRPDYSSYLSRLALPPDASRLDILGRSGGEQKGDSVSVVDAPYVSADGCTDAVFLVRGSRYATQQHDTGFAADAVRPGDRMLLVDDVGNRANPAALLVVTLGGAPVGWVPDLLADFARGVRDEGGRVVVVRNNGSDTPWHMRLLVRLSGRVEPGTAVFTGDDWPARR